MSGRVIDLVSDSDDEPVRTQAARPVQCTDAIDIPMPPRVRRGAHDTKRPDVAEIKRPRIGQPLAKFPFPPSDDEEDVNYDPVNASIAQYNAERGPYAITPFIPKSKPIRKIKTNDLFYMSE